MGIDPVEILIAIQLSQAFAALVLAALLHHFHRQFGHAFLCHWTLSALALAMYFAASTIAIGLIWSGAEPALRLVFSVLSLMLAYPHVVWLIIGTAEAASQTRIQPRRVTLLVTLAALFGAATALVGAFDPDASGLRSLMRVELRYALTGLAFLVAGVWLWRAQRYQGLLGARIGAIGFVLFGLQMGHVAAVSVMLRLGVYSPPYAPYIGLIDFLFQSIIALGIVVWLLELQQRRTERMHCKLEHVRRHDPDTGLPNRTLMLEEIERLIDQPGNRRVAVVALGVSRYAMLHRALGWERTGRLIGLIAERLHASIDNRCALGRIGDRDFVVARPTLDSPDAILDWVEALLADLLEPLQFDGDELVVTFCAGISIHPDDGDDAEGLLRHAQSALVQSARIGRDVTLYQSLDRGHDEAVQAVFRLEAALRAALARGQFEMHYQPIVTVDGMHVDGFEALLRWRHPELGLLRPDSFLDHAASIGLLDALETHALETALKQLACWHQHGREDVRMSVNVSAQRFQTPDLIERIVAACQRHGVAPGALELEITENTALRDLDLAGRRIAQLAGHGIGVALDDFGTGYSSLANLIRLEVRRIKLDREFLLEVHRDARRRELIAAMIGLGHRLGMQVVAEGVESAAQFDVLVELDCDYAQGYFLHKPAMPDQCRFELAAAED